MGCNDSQTNNAPRPQAQILAEGRRATEILTNSARLAWSDFATVVETDAASEIPEKREVFVGKGDFGFRHLLDVLADPRTPNSELLLALQVLNEMAPAIKDCELLGAAITKVLNLRDEAPAPEIRDSCTQVVSSLLDVAIESCPNDAALFYFRGDEWLTKKKLDAAIGDFTRALEIRPVFGNAYYRRGLAHRAKGEQLDAISDLSAALKIEPNYPHALVARAAAYLDLSQPEDALRDLTAAISQKPEWAHAYKLRAHAYRVLGDDEKSKNDLTRAEEIRTHSQSNVQ